MFILTALALIAFAANSLLARAALLSGEMSGLLFTVIRLVAGAIMLLILVQLTRKDTPKSASGSWMGAFMLLLYALMFSLAYLQLETGLGALCLFASVQLTIMVCSIRSGELHVMDVIGAAIALAGLAILVWPNIGTPRLGGIFLMALSGLGWGLYTWLGRGKGDPLILTFQNFTRAGLLSLPLLALVFFTPDITTDGIILAIISGAVTSGMGYAVWYAVLPKLDAMMSGISQLLVPPLAALMGWAVLGEVLTLRFWIATAIILAGLLLAQSRNWVKLG